MSPRDNESAGTSRRTALRLGAIGGVSFLGLSSVARTDAQEGPTTITECRVIDEPGEYVLGDDLSAEGDCLSIRSAGVTLDGNGHTLEGDGTGTGLYIESGGTVRNLTIQNFEDGSIVWAGGELSSVTIQDNERRGIWCQDTVEVLCEDSTIRRNGERGISISDYSRDVIIRNCDLVQNPSTPISAGSSAIISIEDCRIVDNGGPVHFAPMPDSRIEGTHISGSDGAGLRTAHGDIAIHDNPTPIRNCVIRDCDGAGIEQPYGFLDVRECTLSGNRVGYQVGTYPDFYETTLRNSNIEDNEEYGLLHTRSDEFSVIVDARCNWWGHESGPVHESNPTENPQGQRVSDDVTFIPWSVERIEDGEGSCEGGLDEPDDPPEAGTGYVARKSYRKIMGVAPYDDVDCWGETIYVTDPSDVDRGGFDGPGEITIPSPSDDDHHCYTLTGHVIRAEPDAVPVTLPTWGDDQGDCESLLFVDPDLELHTDVEYRIVTDDPDPTYESVDTGGFAGTIDEIVQVDFEPTLAEEPSET